MSGVRHPPPIMPPLAERCPSLRQEGQGPPFKAPLSSAEARAHCSLPLYTTAAPVRSVPLFAGRTCHAAKDFGSFHAHIGTPRWCVRSRAAWAGTDAGAPDPLCR